VSHGHHQASVRERSAEEKVLKGRLKASGQLKVWEKTKTDSEAKID